MPKEEARPSAEAGGNYGSGKFKQWQRCHHVQSVGENTKLSTRLMAVECFSELSSVALQLVCCCATLRLLSFWLLIHPHELLDCCWEASNLTRTVSLTPCEMTDCVCGIFTLACKSHNGSGLVVNLCSSLCKPRRAKNDA